MRNRGLMTVCVLTFGLVALLAVSAGAQTTQPAGTPAGPDLAPIPDDNTAPPPPAPAVNTTGNTVPAGDPNTTTAPVTQNRRPQQEGPDMWLFGILLGGVVLMWLWMGRGRRKQQAQRKEMLANLKKGDKITTIGGIIGTVIEAKPTEITVKVDETNNVRMKFTRGAIHSVGTDGKVGADDDSK